jgi:Fe2+ or Zn2+ uptake regulation protein
LSTNKAGDDMHSNHVGEFLKDNGIKPSYQRIKIYEYLMGSMTHPTVDTIYNALCDQIPTLSKTTVYNTLKVFIDKGIAMAITIDDNEVRYDTRTDVHGHFKCEKCNEIYDFKANIELEDEDVLRGFEITKQQLFFYGVCKHCSEAK